MQWEYLALTDGTATNTLELTDNQNYALASYAPLIAPRRVSELGGVGLLDDVQEQLTIHVLGASEGQALQNLRRLIVLQTQVVDWRDDDTYFLPVLLRGRPQCSLSATGVPKLTTYEACLLTMAGVPPAAVPEYSQTFGMYMIANVTLTVTRRGAWLNESDSAASSAVSTGAIWSVALPNHDEYSPVDVVWNWPSTSLNSGDTYLLDGTGMVMTTVAADLAIYDSASFTFAGSWASNANANALSGSVARLTPGAIDTFYSVSTGVPSLLNTPGQYMILASVTAQTSGGVATNDRTWTIGLDFYNRMNDSSSTPSFRLPLVTHSYVQGYPYARMVPLGLVTIAENQQLLGSAAGMQIRAAVSSVASTPVLDIDYLVIARVSPALTIFAIDSGWIYATSAGWGTNVALYATLKQRLTTARRPRLQLQNGPASITAAIGATDSIQTAQKGTAYAGVWVGGNGAFGPGTAGVGRYRMVQQVAGNAMHTTTFSITRRRAYAIPE